jgi:hypothetical protein
MLRTASWVGVTCVVLLALAGCGKGLFQSAERAPWRAEAELACLKSGAVRESPDLVRINPISGPGSCGADYPLKVAALGESGPLSFNEEVRPPAAVGGMRWNVGAQPAPAAYPQSSRDPRPGYAASATQESHSDHDPVSLNAPGNEPLSEDDLVADANAMPQRGAPMSVPAAPSPRLGPGNGSDVQGFGPVAMKPAATLACPIVSVLDRWLGESVQPAAMRWFGQRVVEIKQISAYSCRGMNGNSRAHISEHAFGNALDIAAFTLADGRRITVRGGWNGMPEEQGFLRDVQASACSQFNTVLAPGSNQYHADHIHVDLMRRKSQRVICQPAAVSGEQVAARAQSGRYAGSREGSITGSIKRWFSPSQPKRQTRLEELYENE